MARRRYAVLSHGHIAGAGDFGADLGGRQDAAMAGLCALAQLDLDHLDLLAGGDAGESLGGKGAIGISGAEIAGAQLPDDVAAEFPVIGAEASLTGIVREAALFGALVERPDGV